MNLDSMFSARGKRALCLSLLSASAFFAQTALAQIEQSQMYDFGDAPDDSMEVGAQFGKRYYAQYPTLLGQDGARHLIGSLRLGNCVDAEYNGQPSYDASGDDDNVGYNLSCSRSDNSASVAEQCCETNDEDGIDFQTTLFGMPAAVAGSTVKFRVRVVGADTLAGANLSAFFDFRYEGWSPSHDALINKKVVNGDTDFSLKVPSDAVPGLGYARFRVASKSVGLPTGAADDGEVEDYPIMVLTATNLVAQGFDFGRGRASLQATMTFRGVQPVDGYIYFYTKSGYQICSLWIGNNNFAASAGPANVQASQSVSTSCAVNNEVILNPKTSELVSLYDDLLSNGFTAQYSGSPYFYLASSSASSQLNKPGRIRKK